MLLKKEKLSKNYRPVGIPEIHIQKIDILLQNGIHQLGNLNKSKWRQESSGNQQRLPELLSVEKRSLCQEPQMFLVMNHNTHANAGLLLCSALVLGTGPIISQTKGPSLCLFSRGEHLPPVFDFFVRRWGLSPSSHDSAGYIPGNHEIPADDLRRSRLRGGNLRQQRGDPVRSGIKNRKKSFKGGCRLSRRGKILPSVFNFSVKRWGTVPIVSSLSSIIDKNQ